MKDAVQCRNCALCCHKKCVFKCQTSTTCTSVDVSRIDSQPEITMTEVPEDQVTELSDSEMHKQYSADTGPQTFNGNGMKRVNSVNSLTIPGRSLFNLSMQTTHNLQYFNGELFDIKVDFFRNTCFFKFTLS